MKMGGQPKGKRKIRKSDGEMGGQRFKIEEN